jgi:hypothetical protein
VGTDGNDVITKSTKVGKVRWGWRGWLRLSGGVGRMILRYAQNDKGRGGAFLVVGGSGTDSERSEE